MISPEIYAQALYDAVSESKPNDHDKILDNFVKLLSDNGDLRIYEEVEKAYQKIDNQAQGIKQVDVKVAQPPENKKELFEYLNNFVGGKAEIKEQIDQNLIGGVVIRVDDTLLDGSVKTTLNNLKKTISKG